MYSTFHCSYEKGLTDEEGDTDFPRTLISQSQNKQMKNMCFNQQQAAAPLFKALQLHYFYRQTFTCAVAASTSQ